MDVFVRAEILMMDSKEFVILRVYNCHGYRKVSASYFSFFVRPCTYESIRAFTLRVHLLLNNTICTGIRLEILCVIL